MTVNVAWFYLIFFIPQHNQLQVLLFNPISKLMIAHLPISLKQHPVTSIYLLINSTQFPEASKKFHTFLTQRAKWPQGRGGWGSYRVQGWGEGAVIKTFTDEDVINV